MKREQDVLILSSSAVAELLESMFSDPTGFYSVTSRVRPGRRMTPGVLAERPDHGTLHERC